MVMYRLIKKFFLYFIRLIINKPFRMFHFLFPIFFKLWYNYIRCIFWV